MNQRISLPRRFSVLISVAVQAWHVMRLATSYRGHGIRRLFKIGQDAEELIATVRHALTAITQGGPDMTPP